MVKANGGLPYEREFMKIRHIAVALAALLPAGTALAQSGYAHLTPKKIGYNENLPDRYAVLDFSVTASDWMDRVRLPSIQRHHDSMQINIVSVGARGDYLEIKGKFAHLPDAVDSMIASPFTALAYRSNLATSKWELLHTAYREIDGPNERRWRIPSNGRVPATALNLRDGQHVGELGLPDGAHPYDTVTVRHTASWPSAVVAADTLFPRSNLRIESGDVHHYVFDPFFRRWKLNHATYRPVPPNEASQKTTTARTRVTATNENFRGYYLDLPHSPSDRDRRMFKVADSKVIDPSWGLKIKDDNIFDREAHVWTNPGEEFEFMYVDDGGPGSGHWHALRYPVQRIDIDTYRGGKVDNAAALLTWVTTGGGTVNSVENRGLLSGRVLIAGNRGSATMGGTVNSLVNHGVMAGTVVIAGNQGNAALGGVSNSVINQGVITGAVAIVGNMTAAAAGMTSGSVRNLGGAVTGVVGVAGNTPVAANPGYTYAIPSTGVVNQSVTVLPAVNLLSM